VKREINEIEYLNYSMGQPYNIVTAVRLHGDLSPNRLRSALDKAQQRHPLLKVNTILDGRGIPWFTSENVGSIPLTAINRLGEDHALRITERELNSEFDMNKPGKARKPLLRVTLLQPKDTSNEFSDVILCAQHTIADGMSMVFLVRDLMQFMTDPTHAVNVLDVTASIQDIFPPEVREQIPKSYVETAPSLDLTESARKVVSTDRSTLSSKIRTWQWAADRTESFLMCCKNERVTVQSALCTAFLTVFPAVLTPTNLRPQLALPVGEAFGLFAGGAIIGMKYDEKQSFWDNARQFHSKLQQELADPFAVFRQFSKHTPVKAMQEFRIMAGLRSGYRPFAITNLGSLDKIGILLQMGDLRVESYFGAVSLGILTSGIAVIVYTIEGIMHFHIYYMEPATSAAEVGSYTDKAMSLLESAILQSSDEKKEQEGAPH
jgi:hypothetical protein